MSFTLPSSENIKFCCRCGAATVLQIPAGDNRKRAVCTDCCFIDYQNPKVVAGCLPVYQDKVLLCKRAIQPRHGFWTLPAGYMELNESTEQAAIRETVEEAEAVVENLTLYTVYDLPYISQVYMFYRADLPKPEFSAGEESLEVGLFTEDQIPWNELAFPIIGRTLRYYFADRQENNYPVRQRTMRLNK